MNFEEKKNTGAENFRVAAGGQFFPGRTCEVFFFSEPCTVREQSGDSVVSSKASVSVCVQQENRTAADRLFAAIPIRPEQVKKLCEKGASRPTAHSPETVLQRRDLSQSFDTSTTRKANRWPHTDSDG